MMKLHKKYQAAKLVLPIAGSVLVSGAVSQLPPRPIDDGLRLLAGTASLLATGKAWCDATELEGMEAQNTADDAVRAAAIEADARCNAAYYRRHPNHFRANKPVPEEWRQAWAATGGNPALMAQTNLSRALQPSTLVQPIAQPQTQPIQQPGQVRGGSFDRAAADDSPGTGWGDYDPRPIPPIAHQSFTLQSDPDDAWLDRLIAPSVLLVFGGDGSGKTSMARELLRRRQNAGHQVVALDPHAHPAKWPGCEVVGGGLNFGQIEAAIEQLQRLREERYEQIRTGAIEPCKFPPITFVLEELTDWKSEVSNVDLLILKAGDYRKANLHLLMVAHGDSMSQIGAPTGSNEIIKNCVTKLRLFSKPGADGKPIPAFKGELAYPLQAPIAVSVPRFTTVAPTPPIQTPEPHTPPNFEPDFSPVVQGSGLTVQTHEPALNALPPSPEPHLDREGELLAQFAEFKALGMNKAQICFALWGAKKGGTNAYKMASDFYDRLNSKYLEISGDDAA